MQQLAEIGELAARTVQPHDAATRIIGSQLAACPATLPRAVGGRDNATCDVSGWLGRRRHVDRVEHTGKLPTCYRPLPLHCLGRPGADDTAQSTCECEQASVCARGQPWCVGTRRLRRRRRTPRSTYVPCAPGWQRPRSLGGHAAPLPSPGFGCECRLRRRCRLRRPGTAQHSHSQMGRDTFRTRGGTEVGCESGAEQAGESKGSQRDAQKISVRSHLTQCCRSPLTRWPHLRSSTGLILFARNGPCGAMHLQWVDTEMRGNDSD